MKLTADLSRGASVYLVGLPRNAHAEDLPMVHPTRKVHGACPMDCPDTCSWVVAVEEGRAVKLAGDRDHPHTRGAFA